MLRPGEIWIIQCCQEPRGIAGKLLDHPQARRQGKNRNPRSRRKCFQVLDGLLMHVLLVLHLRVQRVHQEYIDGIRALHRGIVRIYIRRHRWQIGRGDRSAIMFLEGSDFLLLVIFEDAKIILRQAGNRSPVGISDNNVQQNDTHVRLEGSLRL